MRVDQPVGAFDDTSMTMISGPRSRLIDGLKSDDLDPKIRY
jgi:hypothetical protein